MTKPVLSDADVQAILKLLSAADHLSDFRLRYGEIEIAYSKSGGIATSLLPGATPAAATPVPAPAATAAAPGAAAGSSAAASSAGGAPTASAATPSAPAAILPGTRVASPMFGTFYRAPAPGAPPFVEVGQAVEADTVVCIIEVMKLMNSITAGVRGTVKQILVADSQPVELGQPLVVIEPAA